MLDANPETGNLVHRINIALADREKHIIAFIAARSGEGTSTIARNYAEALAAETTRKVLIIDAGPLDRARFVTDGIDPEEGLVERAEGEENPVRAAKKIEHNVFLARWLGQNRNRSYAGKLIHDDRFWQNLLEKFDTLVIDAPSPQTSPDGIALAARADAVIAVVEAEEATREPIVTSLFNVLRAADAKLIGTVYNERRHYIPESVYARL